MKKVFILLMIGIIGVSCNKDLRHRHQPVSQIQIIPIIEDSTLSVRALEIDESYLYYGSNDHIGKIGLDWEGELQLEQIKTSKNLKHFKQILTYNNEPLHFRAISVINGDFFAISIGNPARLYCIAKNTQQAQLVYEEQNELVFYDAMAFWNDKEGLAIGDPTDHCMSIIITRDGGKSWHKVPCHQLPKAQDGEAAFAASDTNIAIIGDKAWVATGGTSSRILYSEDKGTSWSVIDTPIIQGKSTTGLYSVDFYDEDIGFGIGGDYTMPGDSINNKIISKDGGKTWNVVANGKAPGYRSCVQFIPYSEGKELVATGFKGIDYSQDQGLTWKRLSDEGFYAIRFINDTLAYAAGSGRISQIILR